MKLHELRAGTRFCFAGNDTPYKVVYRTDEAIHFTTDSGIGPFIVTKEYDISWNIEVEMA